MENAGTTGTAAHLEASDVAAIIDELGPAHMAGGGT